MLLFFDIIDLSKGDLMKKRCLWLIFIFVLGFAYLDVEAKTVSKTCVYEADTCPADGVVAVCHNKVNLYFYSNDTANAEILISKGIKKKDLIKEKVVDWSDKKEEYQQGNRCFAYLLLSYKGTNKVYVSNSKEELEKIVQDKKWKLNDNAFIISGVGSRETTEEDWKLVEEVTKKLKNIESDSRYTCFSTSGKYCDCYEEYEDLRKEIEENHNEILNIGSAVGASFGQDKRVTEYIKLYEETKDKLEKLRKKLVSGCNGTPIEDPDDDPNNPSNPNNPGFIYDSSEKKCVSCGNGALRDIPMQLPMLVRNLIFALQLLVPVILIALGAYDFIRAVVANDEKVMKESQGRFGRRIIAGVVIFFVVAVVRFVFGMIPGDVDTLGCVPCFISDESSCGEPYDCDYASEE